MNAPKYQIDWIDGSTSYADSYDDAVSTVRAEWKKAEVAGEFMFVGDESQVVARIVLI
jgi:hypothetical protein